MTQRTSEICLKRCYYDSDGRCGYCWSSSGLFSSGFEFNKVSTENYNDLLNNGYYRYGLQFYIPDNVKSCCKIFSHRIDVTKFVPRSSQKKAIKRWEKFLANPVLKKKKGSLESEDFDLFIFEEPKDYFQEEPLINVGPENPEEQEEEQKQFEEKFEIKVWLKKLLQILIEKGGQVSKELGLPESEGLVMGEKAQQSIKLLKSSSKKHGDYNTNLLFLLYLENKSLLASVNVIDVGLFVKKLEKIVLDELLTLSSGTFKVRIQENGFISFNKIILKTPEKLEGKKEQSPDSKLKKARNSDKKEVKTPLKDVPKKSKSSNDLLDSELEENCERLKIKFVRAEFDAEAHALYYKHCTIKFPKKSEYNKGASVFRTFFCVPAIEEQTLQSDILTGDEESPKNLYIGNYHMKYYLDGKLIALGVLDIIPTGMQSIYFLYDPDYDYLSLGIIGVIKEIDYMRKLQKYFPDFKYYYLGGYIQTCSKISYKVDYDPAELLCPITRTWVKFDEKIRQKIANGEVRLAEENVKSPEDLDFSEIDLDQYIMWSVKINSVRFFEINENATAKIMEHLRKSVVLLGKKMIEDINFDYFIEPAENYDNDF